MRKTQSRWSSLILLAAALTLLTTYAPGEGRLADESLREKFIGLILGLVL